MVSINVPRPGLAGPTRPAPPPRFVPHCRAVGVGSKDKESPADMRRATLLRGIDGGRRKSEAQLSNFSPDRLEVLEEWRDILDKDGSRLTFSNNTDEMGPDGADVRVPRLLSGKGVWLAREARRDDIHSATEVSAAEGCDIVPDRRQVEMAFCHTRGQDFGAIGFPFHVADGAVGGSKGEPEAELESPNPCAESQAIHLLPRINHSKRVIDIGQRGLVDRLEAGPPSLSL